jgi:transmembrane 9 superfamily protein 2/4
MGMLSSTVTQFEFDYGNMPICIERNATKFNDSVWEILDGNKYFESPYEIKFLKNETCKQVCKEPYIVPSKYKSAIPKWMIEHRYSSNWYIDNIKAGYNFKKSLLNTEHILYGQGIPIGELFIDDLTGEEILALHNHFIFNIYYSKNDFNDTYHIAEFNIIPLR